MCILMQRGPGLLVDNFRSPITWRPTARTSIDKIGITTSIVIGGANRVNNKRGVYLCACFLKGYGNRKHQEMRNKRDFGIHGVI